MLVSLCLCVALAMRRILSSIRRDLNGHTQVFAQSPPITLSLLLPVFHGSLTWNKKSIWRDSR